MRKLLIITLFFFGFNLVQAQETGAFAKEYSFDQMDYDFTRNLYYYVPIDYDASQAYKLVVGFRGGPHSNAGQFRTQLQFLSDSLNAIIICPENEDHFWNNEGQTKLLFKYTVEHVMEDYNIDPNFIYLTGLSYGGRHAVIVAMDTDDGEIPAIRGVIPFAAGSEADLQPNYDSIDQFAPACICIGLADSPNFINVSNNLHSDIQSNEGKSFLNEIPQVGHTVSFGSYPEEMMECINWIENELENPSASENISALNNSIQLYPNPSSTIVQLNIPVSIVVKSIQLFDTNGALLEIYEKTERSIDISQHTNANYLLIIDTNQGKATKQISKVK